MTTLRVRDLVGRPVPFYIRFESSVVPDQYVDGKLVGGSLSLPDPRVTVDSIRDYGNGMLYVTGTHLGGSKYGNYFSADFAGINEITGDELAKVQPQFDEIQLSSLHRNLGHGWESSTDHTFFLEDEGGNLIPAASVYGSDKADVNRPYARGLGMHLAASSRTCLQEHHNVCALSFYDMLHGSLATKHPRARISMKTTMDLPTGVVPASFVYHRPEVKNVYGLVPQNKDDSFQIAESHYHFNIAASDAKKALIIKTLDATMSIACLSMFGKYEDVRRRLVNLPGDYAIKPGRLEYRALSNMWMCSPFTYYLVADVMRKAIALANNGYAGYWRANEREVIDTLVSHDVNRARAILERNRPVLSKMVRAAYHWVAQEHGTGVAITDKARIDERTNTIVNLFFKDVDEFIETPLDFGKNWNLKAERHAWNNSYGKMVYTHFPDVEKGKKVV